MTSLTCLTRQAELKAVPLHMPTLAFANGKLVSSSPPLLYRDPFYEAIPALL
jgi:hypothetical protein